MRRSSGYRSEASPGFSDGLVSLPDFCHQLASLSSILSGTFSRGLHMSNLKGESAHSEPSSYPVTRRLRAIQLNQNDKDRCRMSVGEAPSVRIGVPRSRVSAV